MVGVLRTLQIMGPPRTKKNHGRVIYRRDKQGRNRKYHVGSEAHQRWELSAAWQLRAQWGARPPIDQAVRVTALVYRKANVGDLVGYLQAIGDALEKGRVLRNDRLIISWGGSRLLKDKDNPRVELDLVVL